MGANQARLCTSGSFDNITLIKLQISTHNKETSLQLQVIRNLS